MPCPAQAAAAVPAHAVAVDGWKGGINIAHEALDRHVAAGHGDQVAIRWLGKDGRAARPQPMPTWQEQAARFANVLTAHGLKRATASSPDGAGARALCRALGTLKAGLVFTPLFSAFGPEPIRTRMEIGERQRAGHDRGDLQAQDREVARRDPDAEAGADRRRRRAGGLRRARPAMAAASTRFETGGDRSPRTRR
jgi:acetyl-CoA synthetase